MANEVKWAPVFDADRRPVHKSSLDELENVGVTFNAYRIADGQLLTFEKNPEIAKQDPRNERQRPSYLVACKRDGIKSWFNPSFLLSIDYDMQPIYPTWAALGSAKAVVETLIKMGSIKGGKPKSVKVAQFNRDGSVKQEALRDEAGNILLNDDQTPKMVNSHTQRDYPTLPDPVID